MRISGLATGMDTEQIIKDMMKAHRLPLEKITQKKQYLEWQMDDYRSVNRNITDLKYKVTDTMGRQQTFMQKTVNISNPGAVGIKATNATGEFSGSIKVDKLATQASLQSGALEENMSPAQVDSKKLSELGVSLTADEKVTITAPNGKVTEITVTAEDTLGSFLQKINKAPNSSITAFYDAHTGKIAMTAKDSGEGNITISSGNVANSLKLSGTEAKSTAGNNAEFVFNGLTTQRSSNTFTINGFEVNLKQVTNEPVTFSSAPDTDKIVESVVKFVDDYNKMIEELNEKIREPRYRNFQPLSDEQKKDMKEKEIELWEEKAKSGTLRNDPTIASLLTNLRQLMNEPIQTSSGKVSLKDLGIEPIKDFKENGKLSINEDDLRKAITENPNQVYELFAKSATDTDKGGIAIQFRKTMDNVNAVISEKAGTSGSVSDNFAMGRSMKSMNQQIDRFENRLKMLEDRYWRQFTAMEQAIQRANAQSANMMNMFGQ
ncbi:flagellar hook-associated protein 2 [Sporosarcina highlanderae]|uniref:Flagellar hook-associated protein 2 n=1 Tax=Sporosarcina highlanderae TaxID=3035916 RepID=A0ABT8JP35_9BACL|nr:flagellar hook-associated protein 2 [Sporosarcina highlanderae]MDN4606825.1 flagellar hook-associated protein 2 [Sporosarcina highlanderae]